MRASLFVCMAILLASALAGTSAQSGQSRAVASSAPLAPVLEVVESSSSLKVWVENGVGGAFEVSAQPVLSRGADAATVRFPLMAGQVLTFAMPDQIGTLYTFRRIENRVVVSARSIEILELARAD